MEHNEQEQLRRKALEELYSLGINPYPAELFEINSNTYSTILKLKEQKW